MWKFGPPTRCLFWVAIVLCLAGSVRASVVYTYDFPGTPGSGLAVDQANPSPTFSTFGDWSRVNVTAGTATDVFEGTFWNNTATFDPTQYESFSITANAGWHLNLDLLTFDESRSAGGPTKGRVMMFINGSTTAYATLSFNPGATWKTETFNFTPTVDADNVTTVEFRFYGWNGGTPDASLFFDNVAVTLSVVPEPNTIVGVGLVIGCMIAGARRSGARV